MTVFESIPKPKSKGKRNENSDGSDLARQTR